MRVGWYKLAFVFGQAFLHKTMVLLFIRCLRVKKNVQESRILCQIESEIEALTCNLIKFITYII